MVLVFRWWVVVVLELIGAPLGFAAIAARPATFPARSAARLASADLVDPARSRRRAAPNHAIERFACFTDDRGRAALIR